MDEKIQDLIFRAIDQTISSDDFDRLQDAIERSDDVRAEYIRAVNLCESLRDIAAEEATAADRADPDSEATRVRAVDDPLQPREGRIARRDWQSLTRWAIAATILVIVGGTAFLIGQGNVDRTSDQAAFTRDSAEETEESLIAGHATLRRSADLQWSAGTPSCRDGDVLPNGSLQFDDGIAEIDFFCGATLIIEGPAALEVESDWSVQVAQGRLRASVPPAARGFVVKAAGSEIIDLGTEFALEVGPENARVQVIDGEVKLRGGEHDGNHLVTGQRRWLKAAQAQPEAFEGLSTFGDVRRRSQDAVTKWFDRWKKYSRTLRNDKRLIAYYPIAEFQSERAVVNAASSDRSRDGQLVGPVNRTTGRFGATSAGLEFDRPGARVRTRIDGEFQAFTFVCWVRIDSLEHRYNALFMGDGYENGEPHWQIRDDGSLMFSVMVDDTQNIPRFDKTDQRMITTQGLHRVYHTQPFWDVSKSGQWFHLAAVYDPIGRRVVQYVDGRQFDRQEIVDKFRITQLRIGPAEIGNWGQPFRRTPWFAVRNLNGTIDELAIFNEALTAEEIATLYEQGKPLGY